MALVKNIELNNGVIIKYHRIVSINIITNVQNIIEISGYTNDDKRVTEKNSIDEGKEFNVFIDTSYIDTEYNPNMSVEDAYNYLKTLPKYQGAIND